MQMVAAEVFRPAAIKELQMMKLRDKMGLFAQFRPAIVYPSLASLSTLERKFSSDIDMLLPSAVVFQRRTTLLSWSHY